MQPKLNSKPIGAVLIIVLACVVLLTLLVVAFFSRASTDRQISFNSTSQTKADLLAQSALATIIGDLKQEIAAGSVSSTPSPSPSVIIYLAKPSPSPSTLIPALVGSSGTGGLENLVKRSANGLTFYPAVSNYNTATYPPANRAAGPSSQAATTIASQNGRSVSLARWNKPLLLAKATPTGTDVTPVAAFVAPDWIVVARDGSNPTAWNANMITSANNPTSAIGRYAYTIYDEGGLLDTNVAGYPTVSTAAQVGRKGAAAYADLRQLPGISSLSATSQTNFMNNIVGWRNYSSAAATGGNLGTFALGSAYTFTDGTSYYNAILGNRNGFMMASNNSLNGGQSDRMLSGRQELIALLLRGMASTTTDQANLQVALQYLGTFSRELNGPTWSPSTPAGSTINYAAQAETSTSINRDLATVRVTGAFVRGDGTQAVVGEPLLKTRFALTRINELSNTANANIRRDFGLQWNSGQNRWDYVGKTGSTVQSGIDRLDQLAGNREPNFFEILKAVILSGSVGLGSGSATTNTFVVSEPKYYSTANNFSADHQIMQIGANIIDAWRTDNINVPTFIGFKDPTTSTVYELAGVKNLPYLNKFVLSFLFTNNGSGDLFYCWLVPSLWNPHQNAASAPASQDVRFAMTSGSTNAVITFTGGSTAFVSNPIPNPFPGGTYPYIEVKANSFQTPLPPVPSPAVSPAPSNENGSPAKVGQVSATTQGQGYYDGLDYGSYSDTSGDGKNSWKNVQQVYPIFSAGTNFEMQVNVNGTWKAYQRWTSTNNGTQASPLIVCQGVKKSRWKSGTGFKDPEFVALDPRTVRFGVWGSDANDTGNSTDYDIGAEDTMDEYSTGLESIAGMKPQGAFFKTTDSNANAYLYSSNSSTGSPVPADYYNDLDGVTRRGDWTTISSGLTKTTIMYGSAQSTPPGGTFQDRPQILSAPFQSVAEIGQVFRDQPWKTLNFTSATTGATGVSADAGLLDAFTLQDAPMMAGRTSLNTRQSAVLKAVLSQATLNLTGATVITPAQRDAIVTALMNLTFNGPSPQPMISKGELVTRLAADASVSGLGNKEARECVIRAFADACQTRTWNLMIDVIAQSGRYPPNATGLANFLVEGEKRYWLHVAIDRFTGEIIDQQLEAVYE